MDTSFLLTNHSYFSTFFLFIFLCVSLDTSWVLGTVCPSRRQNCIRGCLQDFTTSRAHLCRKSYFKYQSLPVRKERGLLSFTQNTEMREEIKASEQLWLFQELLLGQCLLCVWENKTLQSVRSVVLPPPSRIFLT